MKLTFFSSLLPKPKISIRCRSLRKKSMMLTIKLSRVKDSLSSLRMRSLNGTPLRSYAEEMKNFKKSSHFLKTSTWILMTKLKWWKKSLSRIHKNLRKKMIQRELLQAKELVSPIIWMKSKNCKSISMTLMLREMNASKNLMLNYQELSKKQESREIKWLIWVVLILRWRKLRLPRHKIPRALTSQVITISQVISSIWLLSIADIESAFMRCLRSSEISTREEENLRRNMLHLRENWVP